MVHMGRYGPWSITKEDLVEVWSYRAGISVTALAFLYVGAYALLPSEQESLRSGMKDYLDLATLVGCAGLGLSLYQIHIYVAVLKRALQVLWGVGTLAIAALALTQDAPVAEFVYQHPVWMWAVGPAFAALTGVAFKEGFCYNKFEAAGLFGAIPLMTGGHLLGIWPEKVELGLLASCMVLLSIFAGRKYTQRVQDDIGDKSVFEFLKLPPEQQEAILRKEE